MSGAFRAAKAASSVVKSSLAMGGGFVTINAFQHGRNSGLYEHPNFLRPPNHELKEMVGVGLGIAGHDVVYQPPQDNFAKDDLRATLDRTLSLQFAAGKASSWQINCVKHVNAELYHQGINLRPEELVARTDAHEDMHACASDFTENPQKWCSEKLRTESRIAEEFRAGGSAIGYLAHMSKGLFEASVCIAAQPLVQLKKIATEEASVTAASTPTAQVNIAQRFKGQLASMRAEANSPTTPSISPEPGEEAGSNQFR